MQEGKLLGQMKPLGGGDPIPLKKKELIIGRRPSCDIRLDFEKVSGRHCVLSYINGTWHVRDLGSTNGTKINGQKLSRVQGILPDDELAIANYLFHIDYEPAAPLMDSQQFLGEEEAIRDGDTRKPTSLMELAGFTDSGRPPSSRSRPQDDDIFEFGPEPERPSARSSRPPEIPDEPLGPSSTPPPADDDDFFKIIEDEVRPSRG